LKIGLFVDVYLPEVSGVTMTISWLREELEALGHRPIVYAPAYQGASEDEPGVFRFRSRQFAFHKSSRVALPFSRAAARSFRELDVVHSSTPFSLGLAALHASLRHDLPHVHTYHTHLMEDRSYLPRPIRPTPRQTARIIASFCNRCDAVTAHSTPIREELLRYGVRRPIHLVPFGIRLPLFEREAIWQPRETLGIPPTVPLFLYAGRLAVEKNLGFLLRAFERLVEREPQAVLVIAGDGPTRRALEAQAASSGLGESVVFTGFLDQPRLIDLYKAADLFLFASKTETQGLVLVEAMAAGTPAVVLGELGVVDFVHDEVNGVHAPEEEAGFAAAALALFHDAPRRGRLAAAGLETARNLSTRHSTLNLLGILEACIASPRMPRRRLIRRFRLRRTRRLRSP